jgi:CheY-like chemotaxis protein
VIATYSTSKRIVLCIADDQAILLYEQALLERSGYAVLMATSEAEALRLVTVCKCDAVLLDYEMPEWSGYEVAFQIKRACPDVTIILISGSEVPTYALALADAFVPKLDASQQLLPMIAELCSRNRDEQEKQGKVQVENQQ